ncbi:MAG TPA: hypothetical protein DCP20_07130 [Coriobacteriia bacterium]|nr:MAG: Cytochrome C-type protein: multiheme cytochrome with 12 CxxCH motif [Actinobacteria bacterium 66_15]HAL30474.1 hypothetical protein [Coriobacteriia bacterium]
MTPMEQVTLRLEAALAVVADVFRNPGADREAALLVFGSLFLLLVLVGLVISLLVTSPRGGRPSASVEGGSYAPRPQRQRRSPAEVRARVLGSLAMTVIVVAGVWVTAGVTTASRAACESCHADSQHITSEEIDVHRNVRCVACHEPGGWVAKATANLGARAAHVVRGANGTTGGVYGTGISSAGCLRCHAAALEGTTGPSDRGVMMSHAEPVRAGAECIDCHRLSGGVVSSRIAGMNECLRCHDDATASAECGVCHQGDPALAIAAVESTVTAYAQDLVAEPRCDTCHDTDTCDSCHGISMPHTAEFKAIGHAREGAEDLWNNAGRTCAKCHYDGRRECTTCHEQAFLAHGAGFAVSHQQADWSGAGCTCHNHRSPVAGRNFCMVCHTEAEAPGSR